MKVKRGTAIRNGQYNPTLIFGLGGRSKIRRGAASCPTLLVYL